MRAGRISQVTALVTLLNGLAGSVALPGCGSSGPEGDPCGGPELCDGEDNDCDDEVDEGCACIAGQTQACYSGEPAVVGVGVCAKGTSTCGIDGAWGSCEGQVLPGTEVCTGLDDDCDGQVDEGCSCAAGQTQSCYSAPAGAPGVGICKQGQQACAGGTWGACTGDVGPGTEACDGLDNDCDGEVDNGNPGGGATCSTGKPGTCANGTIICTNGWLHCAQNQPISGDVCDGLDNDCNGIPDDGPFCCPDGKKNGNEASIDCAGACPLKCANGMGCGEPGDCQSGVCATGVCKAPVCGDGVANGSDACDDGNLLSGDGCSAGCALESGWTCTGSPNTCAPICGDGILVGFETCDNGSASGEPSCSAICTLQEVVKIAAGYGHTCAVLNNDVLKCWGYNSYGQLGLGDTLDRGAMADQMGSNLPSVNLGTGKVPAHLSAGASHTCAILEDSSLKCWGRNYSGQLGLGSVGDLGKESNEMGDNLPVVDLGAGKTAVAIAAGGEHTCALLNDGSVKCWGSNDWGQLGLGDTMNRGLLPGQMGDSLPAVNLGTGKTAVAIAVGNEHSCALLQDGSVKCWGRNSGNLGLGDTQERGDQPNEMGDNLPAVNLGTGKTAVALAAGGYHVCALLNDGSLKCWGGNYWGQLGLGHSMDRGWMPSHMGDNLPAVNLGTGAQAAAIFTGWISTCAILTDGSVRCWGRNNFGQLGLGHTLSWGDGPNEMGDNLAVVRLGTGKAATVLAPGGGHTCALLTSGYVKCWGHNEWGELGLGDTEQRADDLGEMGDNLPSVKLFSDVW